MIIRCKALLRDLQERAAMRDYVMDNLEKKADLSDLQSMLSRDDLDDTANAIVTQLQDLIGTSRNFGSFNAKY